MLQYLVASMSDKDIPCTLDSFSLDDIGVEMGFQFTIFALARISPTYRFCVSAMPSLSGITSMPRK